MKKEPLWRVALASLLSGVMVALGKLIVERGEDAYEESRRAERQRAYEAGVEEERARAAGAPRRRAKGAP